jgi:alpha-D-ribose 1-methylphosphonate 5-triphosphate synthase subunit PhnI
MLDASTSHCLQFYFLSCYYYISLVWRTLPGGLYLLSTYKFKAAALDFILERESSDRLNRK